ADPEEAAAPARRLLLVDDDEHILRSLKIYLEMEDFNVTTASSGREALDKIRADQPELVVLDVMMPEMDGFQVLETVKGDEATRKIPVIMLTARGQDADVLRGYQKGASSYMTKPVNYDELVDNIRLIFDNEENDAKSGKS
ncbi:MAG: response regulator, partial [Armatimonadetes bacterium]|nr:response regulator [Armatimonadota bacterium]